MTRSINSGRTRIQISETYRPQIFNAGGRFCPGVEFDNVWIVTTAEAQGCCKLRTMHRAISQTESGPAPEASNAKNP